MNLKQWLNFFKTDRDDEEVSSIIYSNTGQASLPDR